MHITVVALGTRGDVQPMIALSKGLHSAGHQVTVIAGANFEDWITGHGLKFVPSVDMETLMNSEQGLAWTENSNNPMQQVRMMRSLMNQHGEAMYAPILASADATQLFVSGFVSEPLVQSISEKTGVAYINALLQPQQPTSSGAASLNAIVPQRTSLLNLWMGKLSERILWSVAAETTNRLRTQRLGLRAHTVASYLHARRSAPTMMGFSRHVVPTPQDWPTNTTQTGYWFLDEDEGWQPSPALADFLRAGTPPVYIGFGSMSSREPQKTLALILDALKPSGQRAIIAAGWSGVQAEALPENVLLIRSVPHRWLFPRVAVVVHHGGAGTTAAGLRAGKPTLIIPHMSDQPYWGRRMYELEVGVKPIVRSKLTAEALAQGLDQLVQDARLHSKARELSEKINAETGIEDAVSIIERFVEPSRSGMSRF
jgi:sterol 3beta-glucosyltransferase